MKYKTSFIRGDTPIQKGKIFFFPKHKDIEMDCPEQESYYWFVYDYGLDRDLYY